MFQYWHSKEDLQWLIFVKQKDVREATTELIVAIPWPFKWLRKPCNGTPCNSYSPYVSSWWRRYPKTVEISRHRRHRTVLLGNIIFATTLLCCESQRIKQTLPHPSSGFFRLSKFRSVNLTLHPDSSFGYLVWLLWSHWFGNLFLSLFVSVSL